MIYDYIFFVTLQLPAQSNASLAITYKYQD